MANKIATFFDQTITELKKVSWPTRDELFSSTAVVLLTTALLAVFIGVFDYLFSLIMRLLIH